MLIVAGHLTVGAARRADYLAGCAEAVRLARGAPGCLDFAISADLLDPARINVFERWRSRDELEAFRGGGPDDDQHDTIASASITEYDVAGHRDVLTS